MVRSDMQRDTMLGKYVEDKELHKVARGDGVMHRDEQQLFG